MRKSKTLPVARGGMKDITHRGDAFIFKDLIRHQMVRRLGENRLNSEEVSAKRSLSMMLGYRINMVANEQQRIEADRLITG
jgi:hypothetical protein